MLRSISIRSRLTALVLIPLLCLVLLIVYLFGQMNSLQEGINALYQDRVVPLKQIKAASDMYGIATVDLFHKYRGNQLSEQALISAIDDARSRATREWLAYKSTYLTSEEQVLVREADHQFAEVSALTDDYLRQVRNGSFLLLAGPDFIQQLYGHFDPLTQALDKLINLQLDVSAGFVADSKASHARLMTNLIVVLVLLFTSLVVLGFSIYHSVNNPLQNLGQQISRISDESDLALRVPQEGRDEITRLSQQLNSMFSRFQSVVTHLRDAVHQSGTAAEEMSAISRQVSSTVGKQEEQVTLVAAAITEMSGAIREVADNASATSAEATQADEQARQGQRQVEENLAAIDRLSHSVNDASDVIHRLHAESGEITGVLTVIRNIAEQTNLLALNAAIESARAGEAGRGFAVVADEVRKLAQSTQQATESIGRMIDQLQNSARRAVDTMGQASTQASESVDFARAAGTLLSDIAATVSRIAGMNFQVSTATEQQAQVANEIHGNVTHFSMGLSDVAESARQSALASEEIARLSNDLQQQVSTFRV